ncbi:VOC family protein [Sneathiella aquimaris]|uniref:VOC family protein n=1 Tax=Sneathiella aquimaris TaxID=2599305 RepID=UPI00146F4F3E|nr:VOC family protein [Sneathiella aquimaris]
MDLAKQHLDIGLYTNNKDAMLEFWQQEIGLPFDHLGKLGGGIHQHRHFLGDGPTGPILKINHARGTLENNRPSGIRGLYIARRDLSEPVEKTDPDGNKVWGVPHGFLGITDTAIELHVRKRNQFEDHYGRVLSLPSEETEKGTAFRCGRTLLFAVEDPTMLPTGDHVAKGYRYLTAQIHSANKEHAHILQEGGLEGMAPKTLGTTVRYSFVRDLDGNWMELSQRASLTGSLD